MNPFIIAGKKGAPIIMEVVGKNGQTVGEYVVSNDKKFKPPYTLLEESSL